MCVYGIGLPFDHPIWQNLPPCRCYGDPVPLTVPERWDIPPRVTVTIPDLPTSTTTNTTNVVTWAVSDPGGPRPFRSDFERDVARRTLPGAR